MGKQVDTYRLVGDRNSCLLTQILGQQLGRPVGAFLTHLVRIQFDHSHQLGAPSLPSQYVLDLVRYAGESHPDRLLRSA